LHYKLDMGKNMQLQTRGPLTFIFGLLFFIAGAQRSFAIDDNSYVSSKKGKGRFALSVSGRPVALQVSILDFPGVINAVANLRSDLKMVTGNSPLLLNSGLQKTKTAVIIGTLGKSPEIDQLVKAKKLDVSAISGKWETFQVQVIHHPFPGTEQALVIVGSDKRGTIFGIYDLSAKIGVSPWYWWADVPVVKQKDLYILPGIHTLGTPAVKYRGIFLNDEAPALSGWTKEKFGGFNHKFYAHVFELILRLKGNYLWPAMWGNAFYDDDPKNAELANACGVFIGTSHHEPLMRAHDEWRRYGNKGAWNYTTNPAPLQQFWKKGISRMGQNESIVTIGMRGDGDEPMSEGSNIALLEKIVEDQRKIIADVTGKDITATPQVWALYKEVQEYYDKGMRVPDDVTLLLCDDNWGNIRKLPKLSDQPRMGGYGIYYHFDYVGDPRNYKWLNTNPLPRIQEQMNLAYEYGAKQIWIVNVGDLKPMEFPIEFFLDLAWSPKKWPADKLDGYTVAWAEKQFGKTKSNEIASILSRYLKFSSRRKPELLDEHTYSLTNYKEFETIIAEYEKLKEDAETVNQGLADEYKDAYYQLVLHPVLALENLNQLYYAVAKNRLYASQGRAATNKMASVARTHYKNDQDITDYYNTKLSVGKWNHMMDQTHIGYTSWQQPEKNKIPELTEIKVPDQAEMGVAIDGSALWWPQEKTQPELPALYEEGAASTFIEVFNRGKKPFHYTLKAGKEWIKLSKTAGMVEGEERIMVSANFSKAPQGKTVVPILIQSANGNNVTVMATVYNSPVNKTGKGFQEQNGYISIPAELFSKAVPSAEITWKVLPDHGRTGLAITPYPVTAPVQTINASSPRLEYMINTQEAGTITISTYISPTLDFTNTKGLFYGISIDDEEPQLININRTGGRTWNTDVSENIKIISSSHQLKASGTHTIKFWMVNPGVVLQKIVATTKEIPDSYLGPPSSPMLK